MTRIFILLLILLTYSTAFAADTQTELNGFMLQQFKDVVKKSLGNPDQSMETDNLTKDVYVIDDKSYMVFEYLKQFPNIIFSIQLTGVTDKMLPFKGLLLGYRKDIVLNMLGTPDNIEQIKQPKVEKYNFKDTNYSVEFDEKGNLYGIRIQSSKELLTETNYSETYWGDFKKAVLKKDFKTVLSLLRPDVEIYKDGKILSIDKKYSEFEEKPTTEFYEALLGEENSVYAELQKTEAEVENRFILDFGVGIVHTFYTGKILKEIVFFPFNGKFRVYEIAFREK
ncbi:MAG: hypothetical protein HY807_12110 [Nitrospirae bacterium]|nr:hypothetical protein [Nitrospirota bacterium]